MPVLQVRGKEHCKGVSRKTGKSYDFYNFHFLMRKPGVDGLAAVVKTCDPRVIDYDNVLVDQYYDFGIDFNGNIDSIKPAKP